MTTSDTLLQQSATAAAPPPKPEMSIDELWPKTTNTFKKLWSGIDTIKVGYHVQWPDTHALDTLEQQQAEAREGNDQYRTIGHHQWETLPYGRKKYRYGIHQNQLKIFFSREPYSEHTPNVMVEALPETITQTTLADFDKDIIDTIESMGATVQLNRCSELHLTVDIHSPVPFSHLWFYDTDHKQKWISLSRMIAPDEIENKEFRITPRYIGTRLTGMSFGLGGACMCRIYDKTHELKIRPNKSWEQGLWKNPLAENVIRVEFQMRRERIKDYGVNNILKLDKLIPAIWADLTTRWLTLTEDNPTGRNREATPSPFWLAVQSAWTGHIARQPMPNPKPQYDQLIAQANGCLLTAAAIMDTTSKEDMIQRFNETYTAERWETLVKERQEEIKKTKGNIQIRNQYREATEAYNDTIPLGISHQPSHPIYQDDIPTPPPAPTKPTAPPPAKLTMEQYLKTVYHAHITKDPMVKETRDTAVADHMVGGMTLIIPPTYQYIDIRNTPTSENGGLVFR